MKTQLKIVFTITALTLLLFGFKSHGQELFSTIFNEEANWDNPGDGSWTGYNEKTYEEGDWFFHSTESVRGTAAESFGGSAYSFRDRDVFSVHNTAAVAGMNGFSMQLRDWMLGAGEQRNMNVSLDGGDTWETVVVINKDWFDEYQVYQEFVYLFPGGVQSFAAGEFMIELDGGGSSNNGRINIGQFVVLGEPTQVATPAFDPAGGLYFDAIEVNITTPTPEANIYYTLDGSEPTESDNLFTTPIPVDENVTIKARAFKADLEPSNVATAHYFIRTLLLLKDFEDDDLFSGGWTVHDYIEGANTWEVKSFGGVKFAEIREFQSDPPFPHSWYISPEIELDEYEDVVFTFESLTAFRTGDALSVHISEDYSGEGDPAEASWTLLPAEFDPHTGTGYGNWTPSGDLDLSDFSGSVYIGFQYESDEDNNGTWQITNILVTAAEEAEASSNATLATFTVGGKNMLNLAGIVVEDPGDDGATYNVEDFSDFKGIVVETAHPGAEFIVELNDNAIDTADLGEQAIAFEDVILVTVTAEDQQTVKYYKVTFKGEDRTLVILKPDESDSFHTGDEILFEWEAENIQDLLFELFKQDEDDPMLSEVLPADQEEKTYTVPNGMHGSFFYRLSDNDDTSFSRDSDVFDVADNADPGLLEKLPAPGAVNVPVTAALVMHFDEVVEAGEGSINIYKTEDDELVESIDADSDQATFDEKEVHVSFSADLDYDTSYYILIDDTAIKDIAGNHFEGIDNPESWTFTTGEDALICNGDFEIWIDGLPECWFGEKSNISAANVVQYADDPYTGNYAAQLINAGSTHQRFTSQATSVEESMSYEITFWVKGSGEIRTGLFDDRETGFGFAPYNDYIIVESDTWAEHSQIVTAVNTSDIAEFIFSLRNTNEALGHLQLDHVRVEEYMDPPTEVDNLAELRNMPDDGTVYHYTGNAVIVAMDDFRNRKFIQDETAAILIDDQPGIIATEYQLYDVITDVIGKINIHNNMVSIQPQANTEPATENSPVDPQVFPFDEVTPDDQAKLIQFKNVEFVDIEVGDVFENGMNYTISDGVNEFVLRTDFYDVDYIGEEILTIAMDITGIVLQHANILQIVPRFTDDLDYPVYTLEMLEPEGEGVVTPEPGSYEFPGETVVQLIAEAEIGWIFSHWTDNVDDPESAYTSIVMNENQSVQAYFVEFEGMSLPYKENFSNVESGELPHMWTRTHDNWGVAHSNNAGGASAPELQFYWSPVETGVFRAITPLVNASEAEELVLTFMHSVNDYMGGYTLKVQTSFDGETWDDQWELEYRAKEQAPQGRSYNRKDTPPALIEIDLDELAGENFFVAFVFEGNSMHVNYWYIDDIYVAETIEEPEYSVTFVVTDDEGNPIDNAVITLGDTENEAGDYEFENVTEGTYTFTVTALCYQTFTDELLLEDDAVIEVTLALDLLPGDANGDGLVNVLDIIAIANYITLNPPAEFCLHNADVNNDGEINILDVIETVLIFADDTGYPDPDLDSETAHIFMGVDGIALESDGTLAGLQIEILTDAQGVEPMLLLADHEMIHSFIDGVLRIVIFSHHHSPIPAGLIDVVDFGMEIEAEWLDVMAGNLNAEEVPVETHDDITDISDISEAAWKVYPNPVSETLWIEFNNHGQSMLYIMNIHGQTVKTIEVLDQGKQLINIDAGGLTTGLYMIKFKSQQNAFVKKIFVK